MDGTALLMQGVVKRYGARRALDGLDLSVPAGSVFGMVGSNGAGKTTSMAVATGVVRPNAGLVDLLGLGPFDPARHVGRVALLPQDTDLPRTARVCDLLQYYAELQGLARPAARRNVAEILEWVHLADRADSVVRTLSHGMRRRVMIAQAFLGNPELILLDEPMSGLDPKEVANMRGILCARRGRQTIVISSHNLHEVELICDHVAFIEHGRLVRQGTVDAVAGRRQVVRYWLTGPLAALDDLRASLPDVVLEQTVQVDAGGAGAVLLLRYGDTRSIATLNAAVCAWLAVQGVGLLEIRRGDSLEAAYLEQK